MIHMYTLTSFSSLFRCSYVLLRISSLPLCPNFLSLTLPKLSSFMPELFLSHSAQTFFLPNKIHFEVFLSLPKCFLPKKIPILNSFSIQTLSRYQRNPLPSFCAHTLSPLKPSVGFMWPLKAL
ncbi:hypothetical protein AMTRI_Chr08g204870 [Amborella trichopoda]